MPGVLGTLADWVRPRLVNHQLTDADFVRALRRAAPALGAYTPGPGSTR